MVAVCLPTLQRLVSLQQIEQAEAAAQGHDGKEGELMVRDTAAVATGWR